MSRFVFGVDIGGTSVKLGLFDELGTVIDKWEIPTRTDDSGSHILPDIAESIQSKIKDKKIEKDQIAGVGVGAPGPIDNEGVVHCAVNLGWGTFSIRDTLSSLLELPVMAGNDANVAALGEMWKGGGLGSRDMIMVTLGTGVGGGIIINGRMLTGSTGAGGEIGHVHVEDNETQACNCGNYGCLEQYSSATGITRLANKLLEKSDKDSLLRTGEVSAKAVFDAVKEKDALAIEVAKQFGKYLGDCLANVSGVVNPEVIVLGGGVSKAGEILIDFIKPNFDKNVFHGSRNVKFTLATLGNDAGIYGAAKLVLDNK